MSLTASMLPEFDHEAANTRRVLERVPGDRMSWRPHPKSWTMGQLASHVANLPTWTAMSIQQDSLDINPPGSPPPRTVQAASTAALLETFDANVTAARAALSGASDATLLSPWTLMSGGTPVFTMPKVSVVRSFVMNHLIHHRAQLCVYLRLNDIPVPGLYGPSADDLT
jgi:uncharacterized damage-inducible protein DinB